MNAKNLLTQNQMKFLCVRIVLRPERLIMSKWYTQMESYGPVDKSWFVHKILILYLIL